MATYRWDPFTALTRFDREFDELVRRAWPEARGRAARTGFVPAVEMVRDGSDAVVRVELPGVDIDRDVNVEVDKGRLVISGERRDRGEQDTSGVLVREIRYGSFRREFALPEGVGADQVEASYDSGVLEVRVHQAVTPVAGPTRIAVSSRTAALPETLPEAQEPAEGSEQPAG